MKKNLFLGMFAAVGMLFATSCSTDEPEALSGDKAQVTFALDLEGAAQTRAISDGKGATKLVYAVYKGKSTLLKMPGSDDNSQFVKKDFNPAGDNVSLTLIKGQPYTVVFWAQNPDCEAYTTTDLKKVLVNYVGDNNDETRDAFYKAESFTVEGDATINVTLKRPFAQINVGVTKDNWDTAVAAGVEITRSKVTIKNVPTGINLISGKLVSDATNVSYNLAAIPDEMLMADADGDGTPEEYHYLSMSYILAPDTQSQLNDMEFSFKPKSGSYIDLKEGLTNVPVQRNWRTNIIGSFLTHDIDFNIIVDPAYTDDYNYNYPDGYETVADGVMLDAASKTYFLTSKKGLQWLQTETIGGNLFEGYTVKLTDDIWFSSLSTSTWTPIPNFKGTFDGCNYMIENLKVKTSGDDYAGLFATAVGGTIKNLNLKNVTIEGNWMAGAIVAHGMCTKIENCHVNGGSITSTPHLKDGKYDDANNIGGITGYLSAEPQAWVKDCSVNNLTIRAYRDVGGIVGTANGGSPVVSGNTVSNVTVTANQLCEYGEDKDANAGEFVGRNLANADLSTNTAIENVAVNVLAADENGKVEIGENTPLSNIANITNEKVTEVVLTGNVEGKAVAKYGSTKVGVSLPAGITLDGGGNSLTSTTMGTGYVITTKGGTIKNLSAIVGGERGIVTCVPTEDVIIENVVIDEPGYALNTADPATKEGLKLIVRNSTLNGWSSWAGGFASAEFTSCHFGENSTRYWQNLGNSRMFDRFMRPYISTTFKKCTIVTGFYISLEVLKDGQKLIFERCKVDGTTLTADNYADLVVFNISGAQEDEGDVAYWVEKFVEFK